MTQRATLRRLSSHVRKHPAADELERFMRRELSGPVNAWVVRHLLTGCPACVSVTRRLWALADGAPPDAEARE
jgi:hypothetical protein